MSLSQRGRTAAALAIGSALLMVVSTAAVSRARAADGTITPGGSPVTINTSSANETIFVTFSGIVGQRVFLRISGVSLNGGFETANLLAPNGTDLGGSGVVLSTGYIDTKTLPANGTYTIRIYTYGGPGSTTLTLYDVPPDATGSMTYGGPDVTVTTTVAGQDARVTFAGSAEQPVRLRRSAITISTSIVKILNPDGSVLASTGAVGTPDNYLDATLPMAGTYTALVDGFQDATGSMTLSVRDPEDDPGSVASDQSAAVGDDTTLNPAAPIPISPTGPVSPGSYTTELWEGDETETTDGVEVVSSSAPGTAAVTGVVVDGTTADGVQGATVTISSDATSLTTTTDDEGGYAFINMPPDEYDVLIDAVGYGDYTISSAELYADDQYQQTAALLNDAQAVDVSEATPSADAVSHALVTATDLYPSHRRPPPTVRVALHGRMVSGVAKYDCSSNFTANPYVRTLKFPWRYYVLHTAWGEAGPGPWPGGAYFGQVAWTSVAASVHSYGWFFRLKRSENVPAGADLDNTVNFQCFKPGALIPFGYHAGVGSALASRIVEDANGEILDRAFHLGQLNCSPSNCSTYSNVSCSGSYGFSDPTYPPTTYSDPLGTKGILSQLGAKAADDVCDVANWRSIVNYYYRSREGTPRPAHVVDGTAANRPPLPTVSATVGVGQVTLNFVSKVSGTPVAWRYALEREPESGGGFRIFENKVFVWHQSVREIPTSHTVHAVGCWRYRVRAFNPLGPSPYAYFSPGVICT